MIKALYIYSVTTIQPAAYSSAHANIPSNYPYNAWVDEAIRIKCLSQGHNPLAVAGLELKTN